MERNIRERERDEGKRKAAAAKKRRRKKRMMGVLITLLIISLVTLCILSLTVFFKITDIKADSTSAFYSSSQIVNASGINVDDNLLLASEDKASERITTALPYIKMVDISKKLPSTVIISFTETKDELCILSGGKYYTADKDGKILSQITSYDGSLPLFKMSDDCDIKIGKEIVVNSTTEADLFKSYISLLEDYSFKINSVDITDVYDSFMTVENRFTVKFGSPNNFELKVAHFNAMLAKMSEDKQGIVDLSAWSTDKQEAFFTASSFEDGIN